MSQLTRMLIERQIAEVLEEARFRADVLRSHGFVREALKEFAAKVLSAVVLARAYCMYSYLDAHACKALEESLKSILASATNGSILTRFETLLPGLLSHATDSSGMASEANAV
uniref:Uncharacterized protein n=1 Tax=Ignisphaera aggregans TaxID=334771 RepID=A0A7C2Z8P7_9CREN